MESPEIPVINRAAEDRLMAAFDGLDADLGRLLADFRKLKRDRKALLTTCWHLVAVLTRQGGDPAADVVYAATTLKEIISRVESDE